VALNPGGDQRGTVVYLPDFTQSQSPPLVIFDGSFTT
jgi:hypothetical protein